MTINVSTRAVTLLAAGVLALGVLIAAHEPADKTGVAATAGDVEFVEPNGPVTVLEETLKVSQPTELILGVTAECSILSTLTTVGDDSQSTTGELKLHLEIDGEEVPISEHADAEEESGDIGRVVFCNRTYQRETSFGSDDENDRISDFLETRTANAFNWVALDAGRSYDNDGDGLLHVEVIAEYEESSTATADSEGVIGNRSLVIEPTKAKVDEDHTSTD